MILQWKKTSCTLLCGVADKMSVFLEGRDGNLCLEEEGREKNEYVKWVL